jgi:uncharacterized protein with NRDE domain
MCLALIAFAVHPRYRIVVAANRDEFHARTAAPSAWWAEGFLAGRDLEAGGTWLGVSRHGRFALLTNVRDPSPHDPHAPSRGTLVPNLLSSREPLSAALPAQVQAGARHNGFNLVAGDLHELLWGSNRAAAPLALEPGFYGVSNHLLDTPWPKVERTKAAFRRWCQEEDMSDDGSDDLEPVLGLLHDTERAPDADLPATGVTLERERMLSAPFIVGGDYGTRCSTVLTITPDGNAHWIERSFDSGGTATGDVEHRFRVSGRARFSAVRSRSG